MRAQVGSEEGRGADVLEMQECMVERKEGGAPMKLWDIVGIGWRVVEYVLASLFLGIAWPAVMVWEMGKAWREKGNEWEP